MRGVCVVSALLLCGCNTTSETGSPPDAKAAILAHKNRLWKDADSIKGASITAPYRNLGTWHVCVRANAKNAFGGYTGENDTVIGLNEDGSPPYFIGSPAPICDSKPHVPFPELDGGYRAPPATAKR